MGAGGKREVGCETSGTIAATRYCHGLWGCPAPPNCLQVGHWSLAGITMSCIPPFTSVWFSSSLPLIDTQSGTAVVGVRGGARQYRSPPSRAEVEVSVAPRSPALAPRGASGWGRCPPGPNEVVWSARRGVLHCPALCPGTLASGLPLVVGAPLGLPALPPPTSSSQCTSPTPISSTPT